MVEEATECRSKAAHHDFYPDPSDALGVEKSIYLAQYPQLYSGVSKQGCPVFISKPGVLNTTGLENITTLEGILNFHWWAMVRKFIYYGISSSLLIWSRFMILAIDYDLKLQMILVLKDLKQ